MSMITGSPCDNATSPINITTTAAKCSTICNYQYKYSLSDCNLTNQGDYLQIKTDAKGNSIYFNNALYNVLMTRLFQPSLHTYNGAHADAELIIEHVGGGNNLLVCIPIKIVPSSSSSTSFFHAFLPYTPQKKGGVASVNVSNWSLNDIVPKGPYYFYNGTAPYPPCTGSYNIIAFSMSQAVEMSQSSADHLTSAIQKNTITTKGKPAGGLFINNAGTGTGASSDDIFIDCQPVKTPGDDGTDGTDTGVTPPGPKGFDELWKSPAFAVIMGVALITLLKKIYGAFLNLL